MSKKLARFLDMFSEYKPNKREAELLEGALIAEAEIDREKKRMELSLRCPLYIGEEELEQVAAEAALAYGLEGLRIDCPYSAADLERMDLSFLSEALIGAYAPAASILAGAVWDWGEGRLTLRLRAKGAEDIQKYAPVATELLRRRFGLETELTIEGGGGPCPEELENQRAEILKKAAAEAGRPRKAGAGKKEAGRTIYGRPAKGGLTPIEGLDLDMGRVNVCGQVFSVEHRELKNRGAYIVCFDITDFGGSVRVSRFMEKAEAAPILKSVKKGMWLRVSGRMSMNRFDHDMVLEPTGIAEAEGPVREDKAPEKRVELHLHTRMSAMDALTDTTEAIALAAAWGHEAIAITDHGVVQSFPEAMKAGEKYGVKIIYGLEAYFINDIDDRVALQGGAEGPLEGEFVCFDLETTGLNPAKDEITEIGAVVYRDGGVAERFQTFVNPGRPLSRKIVELTGITDEMLKDAPPPREALEAFADFIGDRLLVAHNADFDMSFLRLSGERAGLDLERSSLDTLVMAQNLLPELSRHKLNLVAEALELPEFQHHRAVDDAVTVALILEKLIPLLREGGAERLEDINGLMAKLRSGSNRRADKRFPRHMIILAKNQQGIRNLYQLVSKAHLENFKRHPRIFKSELNELREGLILGTACESGELFAAVASRKSPAELRRIASYYDYLEIQPVCNNGFMLSKGFVDSEEEIRDFNRTIVRLGEELGLPVVAAGDVHFLHPQDEIYRSILLAGKGFDDADSKLPLYFKTTDEMLEEFAYLGEEKAFELVVTNPKAIAASCGELRPLPKGLYAPSIENSAEELQGLVQTRMNELYGDKPPEQVRVRAETELGDIIGCNYDVIYMSAQKLVAKSLEDGYLVGSRGSVGSSVAAYLSGITEVNSFPAHYRCPSCKHSDFDVPEDYSCGVDLPDKDCPVCGSAYVKDGFDIPFETFLGFGGDKIPDIDLNFSGNYQARAHRYTFELFGQNHVFRAGTISTLADKTAYGYVKKYLEERGLVKGRAEENRLAKGCVGVKRTTGQHPGGLVVIPADKEIWDFCPVQRPADAEDSEVITTHFEYHSMEENLLKLDLLGHDDPTMIRMLHDLTGIDPVGIPLDDPETMSLFTSPGALGLEPDKIIGQTGACAIPEFGTRFVREMLTDVKPERFETLVQISGFSHGTDVWLGNAKELLVSGTAKVKELVSCRDDIMLSLIAKGMDERLAFKIMESVRKGRGVTEEQAAAMKGCGAADWYIDSCNKIKYLFPKAHAVAYVLMAFRIAWYKVHEPLAFYAAYFTIRAVAFDALIMCGGLETVKKKIAEINNNPKPAAVEKDMLVTLEVCYEFYMRGFSFAPPDIYKSHATEFLIEGKSLIPPFSSIAGLGETVAAALSEAREGRDFISIDEISQACSRLSKTNIEQLKELGAFGDLPDSSQFSLF